jgi:hypothetical protein
MRCCRFASAKKFWSAWQSDEKLVILSVSTPNGGIAQLGERLHGMQEVSGSIPLTSTKQGVELF